MYLSKSRLLLSTVFLTALLGGCSGSSSTVDGGLLDDPTATDGSGTDTGSDTGADTSGDDTGNSTGSETGGTDTGSDTGSETGGTDPGSDAGSDTGGTDTGGDAGSDTGGTDTGGDTGSDTGGTDTGGDTGSDNSGTDTGSDTGSETDNPPTDETGMLIPVVEPGSDLERLLKGLHMHVGSALLDLNQRLSSGIELSEQQEICLGAYDPALGEQLTAIDCGTTPLAIDDHPMYLNEAAFYDTDSCHASLSAGNSDNCQLQSASLIIKPVWEIPPGERRPVPTYSGALVNYAVGDSLLRIDNDADAVAGNFNCTVDLVGGATSSTVMAGSCGSILASTADRLDALLKN